MKTDLAFLTMKNGLKISFSDLQVDVSVENGYEFLSREKEDISPQQRVTHLFLRLKTKIENHLEPNIDDLYLHIISVNDLLYWDHTNIITTLVDELDDVDFKELSHYLLTHYRKEIQSLAPLSSVIFSNFAIHSSVE